jgi:hypothetical protein
MAELTTTQTVRFEGEDIREASRLAKNVVATMFTLSQKVDETMYVSLMPEAVVKMAQVSKYIEAIRSTLTAIDMLVGTASMPQELVNLAKITKNPDNEKFNVLLELLPTEDENNV